MINKKREFEIVKKYQKEIILLNQIGALTDWDQQTYMPFGGKKARAEQSALVGEIAHRKIVSPELFSSLRKLKTSNLKSQEKLIFDRFYKDVLRSRKLPPKFVAELSRTSSLAHHHWIAARRKKNFKVFENSLGKIVKLKRKEVGLVGFKGHCYNALLDFFEEGMTAERLKPVFLRLKKGLINLIDSIESSDVYRKQKRNFTNKKFHVEGQEELVRDVMKRIGLKAESSRVDVSEHPFTTRIGVGDVRITTAYRDNPLFSFEAGIHEAGHALYETNLPEKHIYDVLGDAPSLGIHESQSRIWENNIGKSKDFWRFYFPIFMRKFKMKQGFEDFYREVNFVNPGMIRVESDEVHYCLHVILRFELELGLIDGSLRVKELSKVWNEKTKEFFGRKPGDDVEGVLQDVHWSMGAIGYFPTYALGSIYASQLYEKMKKKFDIGNYLRRGDFRKISLWLKEKVHKHGSRMLAEEIIKKECSEGLNPEVYLRYLNNKYGEIYEF